MRSTILRLRTRSTFSPPMKPHRLTWSAASPVTSVRIRWPPIRPTVAVPPAPSASRPSPTARLEIAISVPPSAALLVANRIFQELELHVEPLDLLLAQAVAITGEHLVEPANHVAGGFQPLAIGGIRILQHVIALGQARRGGQIISQQAPHVVHAPRLLLDLADDAGGNGMQVL